MSSDEGVYLDANGHQLEEYDDVLLTKACEITLSTGEILVVPGQTRATILMFMKAENGRSYADLEVYPDHQRFGFRDLVETTELVFLKSSKDKLQDQ